MAQGRYGINSIVNGTRQGELHAVRGELTRIKIWGALHDADKPLQTVEIADDTKCSYSQVKSWLDAWVEHGFVARTALGKSPTGGKRFEHTSNHDSEIPPLIDLKGRSKGVEHRQYAWEAIRVIGAKDTLFKPSCIVDYINNKYGIKIHYKYLMHYLRDLHRGRYLWLEWRDERDPVYRLDYDTGKLAPSLLRDKLIFDANFGVIINTPSR